MLEKKAAASTAARGNELLNESYWKDTALSSLKMQIGEIVLLLLTGNGQPDGWQQFERLLRQHVALRH